MIHRLIIYNRNNHKGLTVFNRGSIDIDSNLLLSLIESMLLLSMELGKVEKGYLKEIEIGRYQISLLDHFEYTYIVIQGTYDNELLTRRIINLVIDSYHEKLISLNFKHGLSVDDTYQEELGKFIMTLNFPDELLPVIEPLVEDLIIRLYGKVDLFFITDLDNGIANIFKQPDDGEGLITLLMQILSEIPLEKAWIGESRVEINSRGRKNEEYESWIIQRIGLTEFCIMARAFYSSSDRDTIVLGIDEISDIIHDNYINWALSQDLTKLI